MVLHTAFSSEDAVVVAAGADVLVLMIYVYSKFMLKQRWVLDTRITNVLIVKQFYRIFVNDMP